MRKFYLYFALALFVYIVGITAYLLFSPSSLPPEWQNTAADPATFMTPEQLERSVAYSRMRNIVSLIAAPLEWGIYLLILGLGWAAAFRRWTRPIRWNIVKIFFFLLLLSIATTILQFPLDYFVFQLRHEYGIATQPFGDWIGDRTKSFFISLLITTPIVWLFYALLKKSPKRWWLWMWVCSIPIVLLSMFAQPVLIDPVFNEFAPIKDQQLREDILRLAERADVPADQVYEVDMSKKTNALNAYVTGIGSNTRIVLWDTTLQKLNKDEALFIMAHEIGHYALNHMTWLFFGSILFLLASLFLLSLAFRWTIERCGRFWGIESVRDLASWPVVLLLFSLFAFASTPIQNGVSRQFERAADKYAMEMLGDSDVAARTFQKLAIEGLSEVNPPPLVKYMLYGHPTLYERILFAKQYEEK